MTEKREDTPLEKAGLVGMLTGLGLMAFPSELAKMVSSSESSRIKNTIGILAGGLALTFASGIPVMISSLINGLKKGDKKQDPEPPTPKNNSEKTPQIPFETNSNQNRNFLATIKPRSLHDYAETKNQTLER